MEWSKTQVTNIMQDIHGLFTEWSKTPPANIIQVGPVHASNADDFYKNGTILDQRCILILHPTIAKRTWVQSRLIDRLVYTIHSLRIMCEAFCVWLLLLLINIQMNLPYRDMDGKQTH